MIFERGSFSYTVGGELGSVHDDCMTARRSMTGTVVLVSEGLDDAEWERERGELSRWTGAGVVSEPYGEKLGRRLRWGAWTCTHQTPRAR